MGFTNKAVFTNVGRNLLASAQDGDTIKITKAQMGEGTLGSQNPATLTALLAPVVTNILPSTISTPFEAKVTVRFSSDSVEVPRDFWWREWGVYAKNVRTGEEVLYCYNNAGDKADYVTAGTGNTITLAQTLVVGAAATVQVVIDQSVAYALQADLDAHKNDRNNPHGTTLAQLGGDDAANITKGTLNPDRLPVVPIAKGGTGAMTAPAARTALGADNAANLTTGTLDANRLPVVPVTKGGTNATTPAQARANLDVPSNAEMQTAITNAKPTVLTTTLPTTGWTAQADGTYRITLTVSGIPADTTSVLVEPFPAVASYDEYTSCGIKPIAHTINSITFFAKKLPTNVLTVYIEVTGVTPK